MIPESLDTLKDIVLAIAGSGLLAKIAVEWNVSRKEKKEEPVAQLISNNGNGNGNGNGKGQYATIKDLMDHAVECPKGIHIKIEEYNRRLAEKMDNNHKETMDNLRNLEVSMAKMEK